MSAPLAPGFLIASPPLGDPNFDRTVVLLALHGEAGALGFVVNRHAPLGLGELLRLAGYDAAPEGGGPVFMGGPVQPSSGWILGVDLEVGASTPAVASVGDEVTESGVIEVGERVRITSSRAAFDALAKHVLAQAPASIAPSAAPDPQRRMVILGYSGWGPGQLEAEIAAGAWLPVPLDESVLFEVDIEQRWERAYALLGLTPAGMMTMRADRGSPN